MPNEGEIRGRVIKYNYGYKKGLMLESSDNGDIIWIPLGSVKAIRFLESNHYPLIMNNKRDVDK